MESLRARLEESGVADELRRHRAFARTIAGKCFGLTLDDLEEFCGSFSSEEINLTRIPSQERLRSAAKAMRRAARAHLSPLLREIPSSFRCQSPNTGPVTAKTLAAVVRDCADHFDALGRQLRPLRSKQNPDHRLFRLRWAMFAKLRTGKPLPSVGTILFNVTFGTDIDRDSYSRMLRRDRGALTAASKARTKRARKSR